MKPTDKTYVLFGEKACIEYMGLSMDSFLEYLSEETPSSYDVVFFNALEKPEIVLYAFEQYKQYAMIKEYISKYKSLPKNLIIRLSAMYPDKPVVIPKSLQGISNITASNVHTVQPLGTACKAPQQNGECKECRLCWSGEVVSYELH